MVTVITQVYLKEGSEPEWDAAMKERLEAASDRPGWVAGQILIPFEEPSQRMIVGTWQTRADWEAWHEDELFEDTRKRLDGLREQPDDVGWHEVIHPLP